MLLEIVNSLSLLLYLGGCIHVLIFQTLNDFFFFDQLILQRLLFVFDLLKTGIPLIQKALQIALYCLLLLNLLKQSHVFVPLLAQLILQVDSN